MSDVCHIRCPECNGKFKATRDKEGKKIRCPLCNEPFRVSAMMMSVPKVAKEVGIKTAAKAAGAAPPAPPKAPPSAADDDDSDDDGNPYGMIEVKVAPRCPSCAKELRSEKDVVCVYCGYNNLTREIGETKRVIETTFEEHMIHLAPALGALAFAFVLLLAILYYCLILPRSVADSWLGFLDSEPMRLFAIVTACLLFYYAGNFGLNQVIFNPKPKEREKE